MHTKAVKGTHLLRCYAHIRKRQHVASLSDNAGKCNVLAFSCTPVFYLIKLLENLEVPGIRVNTHNRHARQDTKYHLTVNQLAGFFFPDCPDFSYEIHPIKNIPPPLPLRQRSEDCALSGGMRNMDMPCPYAAGIFIRFLSNQITKQPYENEKNYTDIAAFAVPPAAFGAGTVGQGLCVPFSGR